ncbi:amino acid ABC transporter permease [Candidatus Haliotispira prima]|uniref:Amino acid ABC transporter permease n=1 Tax=Candidatus Haliotispira prima TaxID=3034016 RepID=A0ABY8MKF8_9SPIO|nr:amino acid ABC transporter permease [Candidatus Haliotispira prima]
MNKAWQWMRRNLFATPSNIVISVILFFLIGLVAYRLFDWALLKATWSGTDKNDCGEGACWAFIRAKFRFFLFGFYPYPWLWRPILVIVLLLSGLYFLIRSISSKHLVLVFLLNCLVLPLVIFVVLRGWGSFSVSPDRWGGLLMTLILSAMGLLFSFPLGIVLALLRTGKMRILRVLSVTFIEFFRGIPLITILFMCSVVLPLFLPSQLNMPKLLRLVIGLTVFQSAYLAEVVRGGLQAINKGQYEAAYSLGMPEWLANYFVILPQALRLSLANTTSISIAFIKDTSLVLVVGWFDLLGIVKPLSSDVHWLGMEPEAYFFVGLVFWLLCATVSRVGTRLEQRLNRYMVARH